MTDDEPTPFMDYWEAVNDALLKFFGIDTGDAGIEPDLIASAQEECETPEEFARWYGEKYDLIYIDERARVEPSVRKACIRITDRRQRR